jgi:beta-lactam-binding protein with PASTA domain
MTTVAVEFLTAPPYSVAMPNTGGPGFQGVTSYTVQATTANSSFLVVIVASQGTSAAPRSVGSITGGGLTFTQIDFVLGGFNYFSTGVRVEAWVAPISTQLNNATITITCLQGYGFNSSVATVFGLIGATAVDSGSGTLPAIASNTTTPADQVTVNTTNASTQLFYAGGVVGDLTNYGPPSGGWSNVLFASNDVGNPTSLNLASYAPGSAQTGLTINGPVSGTAYSSAMIVFGYQIQSGVVPNVVGDSDSVAQAAITSAGFTVGTVTTAPSSQPPGTVLSQSPTGGTTAGLGTAVNLVESEGTVVPNVVNTSLTVVAPGILTAAGFTVGVVTYAASALVIAGNVISQSPAAGSYAALGSAVALVVSTGLPQLTVPDLFGLTQVEAITLLQSLGLVVGAVSSAPSKFVPAGEVQTQNPQPGTVVAAGAIVSFVLSLGTPAVGTLFDFEATVISQYANSPTILQLVQNLNYYIDQSTNFANFYNNVWNINTAVGFGLDNWGKIVGVSRLLNIPNTVDYVGFYQTGETTQDWQTMGSDQPPQPAVGGALYTGYTASTAYLLPDDSYRQLILAKAFSNICATTAPAINQILQNLYGPGTAYVLNTGPMEISYNLTFKPTLIQEAILLQSGVIPTPPGVAFTVNTNV